MMSTINEQVKHDGGTDVIYTPHFRGERYLHHVCSGCGYTVKIDNGVFNKLDFGSSFNFCPNCGVPVARFAKLPVFDEDINRALFDRATAIFNEMEDHIRYYLYIELTDEERCELYEKAVFAKELQKAGGPCAGEGACLIVKYGYSKLSHWDKKKLRERVEGNKQ